MTIWKNSWRRGLLVGASVSAICLIAATAGHANASVPAPSGELTAALSELDAAWQAAPLGFTKALFVEAPATGYGSYEPRRNTSFHPGETIVVYAEPVGYDYRHGDDGYRFELAVDFEILTPTGQVLASQADFAKVGSASREKLREFQTSLSFRFEGLQAGDYILLARFRDTLGTKAGELRMPFSVVPAAQ
ncbi:hypothetical protein H2509_17955 [Stappia sp. F7233]|uniref:Uncharacterized protein n=1 Tax=Stappia albiluteola TaxID=2758565 RepID=A0A839AIX8_9HYPH|nr:hypothetical protein [Stappia albiluteola]MBA5779016.1 hypothetical protein [Stappia albiluteola]